MTDLKVILIALCLVGGCATQKQKTGPVVPSVLAAPAGATIAEVFHGVGVQIYTCTSTTDADAGGAIFAWVLKAPNAKLFDTSGAEVGTHSAGPTWTASADGSSVVGIKIAQADSPLSDAIPWLLLRAASTSGTGIFGNISFIQRVNTMRGKSPSTVCDAATDEVSVDYSADYYFYTGG